MTHGQRRAPARIRAALAVLALAAAPAGAQRAHLDGATPIIEAVLHDPAVARRIGEWGLSTADVKHDVAAMSPEQRARLAYVLTRRWRDNASHSEADLQAQFLVMMSLMRESVMFASIVSTSSSGLR